MKKAGLWVTFLAVVVLAIIMLPVAFGAGKVDKLMGGVFRENDVGSDVAKRDESNTYSGGGTNDASGITTIVATPTEDTHAATKGYADGTLPAHVWVCSIGDGVVTGSTTLLLQAPGSTAWSASTYQNPPADGDARAFSFQCATGVYDVAFGYQKASNRPILDIRIGSTLLWDNLDMYDAAGAGVLSREQTTWTNTVTTSQTIYFIVDGKNGSSSGYYGIWHFFDMRRQ